MGILDHFHNTAGPVDDGSLAQHAVSALDPLVILLSKAWRQARVEFLASEHSLKVLSLETIIGSDDAAEPSAHLDFDRGMWTLAVGAAFQRLREYATEGGLAWDGAAATCERQPLQQATLGLENRDGETIVTIPIATNLFRGELLTNELLGILRESRNAWTDKQRRLSTLAHGAISKKFHPDNGTLTFSFADRSPITLKAVVLGSYACAETSWCWAWANSSYEPDDYKAIMPFREQAFGYIGLGAVWRPGYFCDQDFCFYVSSLVVEESGGWGVFAMEVSDGLFVYYGILDDPFADDRQRQ